MTEKLQEFTDKFELEFGYPPGDNVLPPAESTAGLDRLRAEVGDTALVEFYGKFESLNLPDLENGYFIQPLEDVIDSSGNPTEASDLPGRKILVFGSDGGGGLFALPTDGSEYVYRLPPAEISKSTYMGSVEVLADDFVEFLELLYGRLVSSIG